MKRHLLLRLLGALFLFTFPAAATRAEDEPIQPDKGGFHVRFPGYEAEVAADGCLTNLRINGMEFLAPGVSISRGSYFFQGGVQALEAPHREGDAVIKAGNGKASIAYTFAPDQMTWVVGNATDQPMSFFLVLPPAVAAAMSRGEWARTPVAKAWTVVTFYRGASRLNLEGGTRLWGPWDGGTQVWEATLSPHETRTLTLKPDKVGADEAASLKGLGVSPDGKAPVGAAPAEPTPYPEQDLNLASPLPYQVFQRQTRLHGRLRISGWVRPDCDRVEARVSGRSLSGPLAASWQMVPLLPGTRNFLADLPMPAGGWYHVDVRALKNKQKVAQAAVDHVGVGEVFVGAGQSNSTNCGQERTQQTSGMVSSFSGAAWQLADDPQLGAHDRSGGGSFWPAFGDAMFARYHVPIGVAVTGHGGTSVNQWQPDGELFNWTMTRIYQLGPGGFRALLWHQGESDVAMSSDEYAVKLGNVIRSTQVRAGWVFPWFVAQVSYNNPAKPSFPSTRGGQQKLWDLETALPGPDTDTLTGDNRDFGGAGIHFSPKGLLAHGRLWAAQIGVYLDHVLAKEAPAPRTARH